MIGAIIGDVVGSRFEFDNYKSKDFEMFDNECFFTDDTVMTLAVAKALATAENTDNMDVFKKHLVEVMHEVGNRYSGCGYGGRFYTWMTKNHTEPYNSYGNGSAMRVSPVSWFSNSLEECEKLATASAEVTHNHPEGIKGAVSVAGAIYLARTGHSMIERQKERYGWEFLFIGANIDAVETAARYGIGKDRAVNYNADEKGTEILYETVSKAVCTMRKCEPLMADWSAEIDEDFQKRGKNTK